MQFPIGKLSLAAVAVLSKALAVPIPDNLELSPESHLEKRIVFNPKITSPKAGAVWQAGHKQTVTWKTADIPAELKSASSQVRLGYEPADGKGGENLHWILADKFPLTAGAVSFNLPKNLAARDDYIVVLFGDSGNASPHFSIKAASVQKRGSPKNRLDVL